jgi:hypothetical protein
MENKNTTAQYKEWKGQNYVSEFLSLKCSGDVLNVVSPMGSKASKEITESMGAIKKIRSHAIAEPMKYTLYDLCAGNALTSVLSVFLLPIKKAIAIDKRPRERNWNGAERFEYRFDDIYQLDPKLIEEDSIIISVHPCQKLARKVIEIYMNSQAEHLVLIPCCNGHLRLVPQIIKEKIGAYLIWCWQLADLCNGKFIVNEKIKSPKNCVITASKHKRKTPHRRM